MSLCDCKHHVCVPSYCCVAMQTMLNSGRYTQCTIMKNSSIVGMHMYMPVHMFGSGTLVTLETERFVFYKRSCYNYVHVQIYSLAILPCALCMYGISTLTLIFISQVVLCLLLIMADYNDSK